MGTSGNFSTSNTYVKYTISITQNSQNITNNFSNVTVKVRFFRTNSGYTTYGSGTVYCKINGTTYSASVSSSQKITNSGIDLFNKTLDIYHDSDGSKYLDVFAWINLDTPLTSNQEWYGEWLNTIPRASVPTLPASSVTMGNSLTINTNRVSSNFHHCLYYEINSGWKFIAEGIGENYTWTVPKNFANNVPNGTTLKIKLWLETYNGNTCIGYKGATFTANVPSNVVPTINFVSLSEAVSGLNSQFGAYVQGKSKISGSISASGAYSSTIKSYSVSINGASYNSKTFTTGALTKSGSNSCVVKITDSRNRTASKTVSFNVTAYSNPKINSFSVSRCNSDGTASDDGNCAKCTVSSSIASVGNKNTKSFKIQYKKVSESSWTTVNLSNSSYSISTTQTIKNIDTESEYNFVMIATDYFSSAQYSHNLSTAYTLVDYNKSGKGMAIGKVSTQNAFEVNMNTYTNGTVYMGKTNDEEKNIHFQNLADSQGKTYENDGIYPHNCKMYSGGQNSQYGIGWYDNRNSYRILAYNDHEKKLVFGSNGLYSANSSGTYLDQYGNIYTQKNMTTGAWRVGNNGKNYLNINWADNKITGGIGTIYQEKPLYNNTNGTTGTVTLSDYAYNYSMIDIMYKTNDGDFDTTRVYAPDGKTVLLQGAFNNGSNAYAKLARVHINNKTIAFTFSGECKINTGNVSTGETIYIISVVGYK